MSQFIPYDKLSERQKSALRDTPASSLPVAQPKAGQPSATAPSLSPSVPRPDDLSPAGQLLAIFRAGKIDENEELTLLSVMFLARFCRYWLRRGVPRDHHEDLFQELLLSFVRNQHRIDPQSAVLYLWSMARNRANSYLRGVRRGNDVFVFGIEVDSWPSPAPSSEARLIEQQQQQLLNKALAVLKPEDRELLVLHHIEGLSRTDLADLLQKPPSTIQSRLRIAMAAVRRFVF